MTGTFGSLNIAKTGLAYQQIAIDTANNNIANVNTDNYVRRRANAEEVGGPDVPTMWSTSSSHGEGVAATSVQRLTDALLDSRLRTESGNQSFLEVQQASMSRLESSLGEPGTDGVAQAISDFSSSWQDLVNNPDSSAPRETVIARGQTLAAAINAQQRNITSEEDHQVTAATTDLVQVNNDANQVAKLNHAIFIAQASGTDVGDLQDQRDAVVLDLANLTGATTTVQSDGRYNVSINGTALVTGDQAGTLSIDPAQIDPSTGAWNGQPLVFTVNDPQTGGAHTASVTGGELGGINTLLSPTPSGNSSLADYQANLNTFTQQLADQVNAQFAVGYDLNGDQGSANASAGQFFTYDPDDPSGSIAVQADVSNDPSLLTASGVAPSPDPNYDTSNADAMVSAIKGTLTDDAQALYTGSAPPHDVNDLYQRIVTGLGTSVDALNAQTSNQESLTTQVTNEREQQAGVSIDEETINLMQAERAYQASSRVLNTLDEVLDTLINRTGV